MFYDYVAAHWPYPTMVFSGGNSILAEIANRPRNGLVVGGARDSHIDYTTGSRDEVTEHGSWINPVGYGELPHLDAPSFQVTTAGFSNGSWTAASGTSLAAPQVGAAVAVLQELNTNVPMHPQLSMAGLMVSADVNVDAVFGGVWPLKLHDSIDDRDGAGLLNVGAALQVLDFSAYRNGNDPPAPRGHYFGNMLALDTPAQSHYWQAWTVSVAPEATLRAYTTLLSDPNCQSNSTGSCMGNPYPESCLLLYDEWGGLIDASCAVDQNWQFASFVNTGGTSVAVTIKIWVEDWNGITSSPFAIAWNQ
jgi:hypothetical protein